MSLEPWIRSQLSNTGRDVDLLALGESHDRLLVVRALANLAAEELDLAHHPDRVDRAHLDLEQSFDRRLDLALGGGQRYAKGDLAVFGGGRRLLGDHR